MPTKHVFIYQVLFQPSHTLTDVRRTELCGVGAVILPILGIRKHAERSEHLLGDRQLVGSQDPPGSSQLSWPLGQRQPGPL